MRMSQVNWLHLSDWHQDRPGSDRKIILKKLIDDIQDRGEIDERLKQIDFFVFSGDIADRGEKEQFDRACEQLIEPIRKLLGESVPIYTVPGNHDIQRGDIDSIPPQWASIISAKNPSGINDLLQKKAVREILNGPLSNYYDFANKYACKYEPGTMHFNAVFKKDGRKVGIVCLNTAWLSARFKIHPTVGETKPDFWDHGVLRITETQISDALDQIDGDADVVIAIMHHPLYWLEEMEQAMIEQTIGRHCHIVLHGHEHRPNMSRLSNAFGDVVTIPAGASYNRRVPEDPRYTNAYNFCSVDLGTDVGTIFHRLWNEDVREWGADDRFWAEGRSLFFIQKKQPIEQQRIARKALNQLSRNYLPFAYRRTAISHEIVLRHELVKIDGEPFIKAHVRIAIKLHPGDEEKFPVRSFINKRIKSHANQNVRNAGYKLIKLVPTPTEEDWKDDHMFVGQCTLKPKDVDIQYEYEMLETMEGFYYFSLLRFTDKVEFTLIDEPMLEYEDRAFGGFPSLERAPDGLLKALKWETYELAMPNQGLMVQWYPKSGPEQPKA